MNIIENKIFKILVTTIPGTIHFGYYLRKNDFELSRIWEMESLFWKVYDLYSVVTYLLIMSFLVFGFIFIKLEAPYWEYLWRKRLEKILGQDSLHLSLSFNSKSTGVFKNRDKLLELNDIVQFEVIGAGPDQVDDEIRHWFENTTNRKIKEISSEGRFSKFLVFHK